MMDDPVHVLAEYLVDQVPAMVAGDPELPAEVVSDYLKGHRAEMASAIAQALRLFLGPAPAPAPAPAQKPDIQVIVVGDKPAQSQAHWRLDADGKVWADTYFMNLVKDVPGITMNHLGLGDFEAVTPWGKVSFVRHDQEPIPGKSGRAHRLYGSPEGAERKLLDAWRAAHPEFEPAPVAPSAPAAPPAAAEADSLPPPPRLVPVTIHLSHGGAVDKVRGIYKIAPEYGVEALLLKAGWHLERLPRHTYLHATTPDRRPLSSRVIRLDSMGPDREAFIAWADHLHVYYERHPERLKRGRTQEDSPWTEGSFSEGQSFRYEGRHSFVSRVVMRAVFGGQEERLETPINRDARLVWSLPGGEIERQWTASGAIRLSLETSITVISYPEPAREPARDPLPDNADAAELLRRAGLTLTKGMTKPTRPGKAPREVWEVRGNTRAYQDMLGDLGGRFWRDGWSFFEDPTERLIRALSRIRR